MNSKKEYLIDLILIKLKRIKSKEISLEKEELNKFINFLTKNNVVSNK